MGMRQPCARRESVTDKLNRKPPGGYEIFFILFYAACTGRSAGHKAKDFEEKFSDLLERKQTIIPWAAEEVWKFTFCAPR